MQKPSYRGLRGEERAKNDHNWGSTVANAEARQESGDPGNANLRIGTAEPLLHREECIE